MPELCIDNAANTYGTLRFNSAGAVTIVENDGTNLAGASSALSLALNANGQVVDNPAATLAVTNLANITADGIFLNNPASTSIGSLTTNTSATNGTQVIFETDGINGLNLNAGTAGIGLISGGPLTDTDGDNDFTATGVALVAVGGIGTSVDRIGTTVFFLDVNNTGSGGIFITNVGRITCLISLGGPNSVGGNWWRR